MDGVVSRTAMQFAPLCGHDEEPGEMSVEYVVTCYNQLPIRMNGAQ